MIDCLRLKTLLPSIVELIAFDTVESTNDCAKALINEGVVCKDTLIIAEEQTKGRGTRGRSFYSPKGCGIYMSVILRSGKPPEDALPVTPAAAVAVKRAIVHSFSLTPTIKWVNDILIDGRKVCGILTEVVHCPNTPDFFFVVGIGINITTATFPDELNGVAASLSDYVLIMEIEPFVAEIMRQLLMLAKNPKPDEYLQEYKDDSCVIGKNVTLTYNGESVFGLAKDITREGHLIVGTSNGEMVLSSGEVSIALV